MGGGSKGAPAPAPQAAPEPVETAEQREARIEGENFADDVERARRRRAGLPPAARNNNNDGNQLGAGVFSSDARVRTRTLLGG